jgi:hypothetical protein
MQGNLMAKHSNLGPIDPQLRGIPARNVIKEFEQACREIKADPSKTPLWQTIIGKYHPTFLLQCKNAINWSDKFAREQLRGVMFEGEKNAGRRARKVVRKLNEFGARNTHNQHLHFDDCKNVGLKVKAIETDPALQDALLTVHHCYMHTLMNSPAFKIIENHTGTAFVKQVAQPAH